MDREAFARCLEPALEYYNHTLTEQMWTFYFEELGGMKIPELEQKVRDHMASLKSFPMTSHLRPERKAQIQTNKTRDSRSHPEFTRTHMACINLFEARVAGKVFGDGNAAYPINIEPVVRQAMDYYNDHGLKEFGDHTARSQCRSGIYLRLIKEFERVSNDSD